MTAKLGFRSNQARQANTRATSGSPATERQDGHFVALGIVATAAPVDALRAALERLRPRMDVRFAQIAQSGADNRYRVEVSLPAHCDAEHTMEQWHKIRQTLLETFSARSVPIEISET